jgi:hypothetical protein
VCARVCLCEAFAVNKTRSKKSPQGVKETWTSVVKNQNERKTKSRGFFLFFFFFSLDLESAPLNDADERSGHIAGLIGRTRCRRYTRRYNGKRSRITFQWRPVWYCSSWTRLLILLEPLPQHAYAGDSVGRWCCLQRGVCRHGSRVKRYSAPEKRVELWQPECDKIRDLMPPTESRFRGGYFQERLVICPLYEHHWNRRRRLGRMCRCRKRQSEMIRIRNHITRSFPKEVRQP